MRAACIFVLQSLASCESIDVPPMRLPIALLTTCLLLGSVRGQAYASEPQPDEPPPIVHASVDRILGHWQRGEGEAIIEVTERDGVYSGVIVWSEKRPKTVGTAIFRGLRFSQDDGVWHGRAYSIKRKREVPIDIEVLKRDALELTAHILFFKKRVDFRRIERATLAVLQQERGL